MKTRNFFKLIISIVICEYAGIIGLGFTMPSIPTWYAGLVKPALNPPAWVFGPVWTILFALMGISLFLVWPSRNYPSLKAIDEQDDAKGQEKRKMKIALIIFGFQLVLNTLWSIIFFGLHNPAGAFVDIIFLWLAILATIVAFSKISKTAAWLLVPYILWVSFAAYLNWAIWILNRPR
jgi:tryptophan-rich sensory protein